MSEAYMIKIEDVFDKEPGGSKTAKDSANLTSSDIRIGGMDCADCAAKLEKRISRIPGVAEAKVNFGVGKMTVTHSGPVDEILTVIEKMGYTGQLKEKGTPAAPILSIWQSNQYIKPALVSLVMLAAGIVAEWAGVSAYVADTLFVIGIVLGGYLPARSGISMLITARELDMNFLMMLAVVGAVAIGQLEEAAVVVFLFCFGNALQAYTLDKTRNSIRALMELSPVEALIRRNGSEVLLPVEEIAVGDIMLVRPGERIPMDGKVAVGYSSVNQAPITGESVPVEKQPGDEVYAGTINGQGALDIEITKLAEDNTLSRIIAMVEAAQEQRAPSQQFIDRFAKYYTPGVIVAAALVILVPTLGLGQPFHKWFYEGLGMLLVACPCALIISTPVAIVSAIGSAAKNGVLIKGGMYLEETGTLSVVAFDKTGTLTQGNPQVTDVIPLDGFTEDEVLATAAALEYRSEHPLAQAIMARARGRQIHIPVAEKFQAVPGQGAAARINGKNCRIGNRRLYAGQDILDEAVAQLAGKLEKEGKTVVYLQQDYQLLGLIAVADVLRENSRGAIESLKRAGIKATVMLTGDNHSTACAIAAQAGLDDFKADLLPEDKVKAVQELLQNYGKVAMVGDGVNDAPALATSTVGIAMGVAGTDAALETADIALMSDDLSKLAYAVKLSRKTIGIIKQNIFLSLFIKGLILLLVIPGWLTLWLAIVGDMGTTLLVTLNGMRLMRIKPLLHH